MPQILEHACRKTLSCVGTLVWWTACRSGFVVSSGCACFSRDSQWNARRESTRPSSSLEMKILFALAKYPLGAVPWNCIPKPTHHVARCARLLLRRLNPVHQRAGAAHHHPCDNYNKNTTTTTNDSFKILKPNHFCLSPQPRGASLHLCTLDEWTWMNACWRVYIDFHSTTTFYIAFSITKKQHRRDKSWMGQCFLERLFGDFGVCKPWNLTFFWKCM